MSGGRPAQGKQQRYAELEELAAWFHQALADAGYRSVHEFLATGLFEKNAVYGVFNASRLLTLESTQSLAVALRRGAVQVVDVWMRAKQARDRDNLATQRAEEPRLTSWSELPLPSLRLSNLLDAQGTAFERLPYTLLGIDEPPLSTIYVRQQVQARRTADTDRDDEPQREVPAAQRPVTVGPQATLSVPEALERHDHLLVTGEPGAGKSTLSSYLARVLSLVWLREENAASAPLTEPVVPLRVSARSLDGTGSWSNVLAKAACQSLGRSLLQDPDAGMFAGRVQGARWLILVDGLDEIPDPRVRGEVIRSIAQHARAGSDYRFVVTTRALPESELGPLRTGNVGGYVIQPFGLPELEQFAHQWFTAQDKESADKEAERFLRETSDGRLRELVRNPLLATIAAVSAVREPDRALPTSRVSLYERFCGYLSGSRNTAAHLRHHHQEDPDRLECVLWLHTSRFEVLAALARSRLESQDSLWPVAEAWVRERATDQVTLVEGWEDHLWEELIGTGLLVGNGRRLRFLHQSFAEFLAAQSYADTIGADFADLDTWIRRGLRDADRTFALFTFAMWAGKPGHEIGLVINELLRSHNHQRILLAGRLMAEGARVAPKSAEHVVDRLVALIRNVDDFNIARDATEILGTLFDYPWVANRLGELAALPALSVECRASAIIALEHLTGSDQVRSLLTELLPSCFGRTLRQIAPMALRLGPTAVDEVRDRTLALITEPDADAKSHVAATEILSDLGLESDVESMSRSVFAHSHASSNDLKRAAQAWYKTKGESAVAEIASLAVERPDDDHASKLDLADCLLEAGDTRVAVNLAMTTLESPTAEPHQVADAARLLLRAQGTDGIEAVMNVVEKWSSNPESMITWALADLLKHAADVAPQASIVERVRPRLARWTSITIGAQNLVDAWLTAAGAAAAQEILDVVDHGANLYPSDAAHSADLMHSAGAHEEARELAESALRSTLVSYSHAHREAAEVLLKIDVTSGASTLTERSPGQPRPCPEWFAGVLEALGSYDGPEIERAMVQISAELRAHPDVGGDELRDALLAPLSYRDGDYARELADAALRRPELGHGHRKKIASALAAVGELDLAKTVWLGLLTWQGYAFWADMDLMSDLLCAGAGDWAMKRISELIDDPATTPLRRLRLRQMLAVISVTA